MKDILWSRGVTILAVLKCFDRNISPSEHINLKNHWPITFTQRHSYGTTMATITNTLGYRVFISFANNHYHEHELRAIALGR
jgi:hypothetical protein